MNDLDTTTTVWPCLRYRDARAAVEFIKEAFGFVDTLVVPGDGSRDVPHAELRWPAGGGVMLGSLAYDEGVHADMQAGTGWVYVVTDKPDALFERAMAAGATEVQGLRDEEYGSRGSVTDPEGNHWSFGTYGGE